MANIKLSQNFMKTVLDNCFGVPNTTYSDTSIYIGLGIEFDEKEFAFTKEPVSKGFTINETPCEFNEPINGTIRNINAIEWEKAKTNWTNGDEKISWIGLYYRKEIETNDEEPEYEYELIGVLPMTPPETVLINERMVLNPNTIQIKLENR